MHVYRELSSAPTVRGPAHPPSSAIASRSTPAARCGVGVLACKTCLGTVALAGLCRSPLRVRTLSASRSVCFDPWSRVITLATEQEVVHLIRIRLTRKDYTARC